MNGLLLLLGVVLLTIGGELLIRGSLAVARRFNVSPLLSGLVIVGFGTSTPELVVSVDAALSQQPDIAIGNVVGSNIGNILLILGACALVTPLAVRPLVLRRDAVTAVLTCFLFLVLAADYSIGGLDALLLLLAFTGYIVWAYWTERYAAAPSAELHQAEADEVTRLPASLLWTLGAILLGLLLLIAGSRAMLTGSVGLARSFGLSEAVIGLTIVAVGTSLPELSVSLIAAIRRHADVAVGNILGSNIFNTLGILGVSALLQPLTMHDRIVQFDQWVMLVTSLLLFIFLYTGQRLSRLEGGLLLTGYAGYIALSFSPVVAA